MPEPSAGAPSSEHLPISDMRVFDRRRARLDEQVDVQQASLSCSFSAVA
jgi:hypothetical protein